MKLITKTYVAFNQFYPCIKTKKLMSIRLHDIQG